MRRKMIGLRRGIPVLVGLGLLLAGCGDGAVFSGERGYTKAPLEDPNLIVEQEEPTVMDDLGDPIANPALLRAAKERAKREAAEQNADTASS